MSELVDAVKDAFSPKRREQATAETYDAGKRGPYPDHGAPRDGQPELAPPSEGPPGGSATGQTLHTTAAGRSGNNASRSSPSSPAPAAESERPPHRASASAGSVPPISAESDGRPAHGEGDYGWAAARPMHKEGGKYGLS